VRDDSTSPDGRPFSYGQPLKSCGIGSDKRSSPNLHGSGHAFLRIQPGEVTQVAVMPDHSILVDVDVHADLDIGEEPAPRGSHNAFSESDTGF